MEPREKQRVLVEEQDHGLRLDVFMTRQDPGFSRSYWQKLCRQGYISVDDTPQTKPGFIVKEGQVVEVRLPYPQEMVAEPEEIPLDVLYEDRDLLVINKSRGMVVHPAVGHRTGTLVNALLFHCRELPLLGDKLRPGIVHRLDKDTTGLMVIAKTERAFLHLARQFKSRVIKRGYVAIVHGRPPRASGTIDLPLGRDPRNRKRIAVRLDGSGRRAVTHYKTLRSLPLFSLLSLKLETGRTHQIRVHLAYLHCPVVGDPVYGPRKSPYRDMGQLLHADTLGFYHPVTGEYMEYKQAAGVEFDQFLAGRVDDGWI